VNYRNAADRKCIRSLYQNTEALAKQKPHGDGCYCRACSPDSPGCECDACEAAGNCSSCGSRFGGNGRRTKCEYCGEPIRNIEQDHAEALEMNLRCQACGTLLRGDDCDFCWAEDRAAGEVDAWMDSRDDR
jgi:hypothetical protein